MAKDRRIFRKTTGRNRPRPPDIPRHTYGEGPQLIRLDECSGADGSMPGSQAEAADEPKVTTGDSVAGMDASDGLGHGYPLRLTGTVQTTKAQSGRVSFQEAAEAASGVAEGVDAGMGAPRRQNAFRRARNGMSMGWACPGLGHGLSGPCRPVRQAGERHRPSHPQSFATTWPGSAFVPAPPRRIDAQPSPWSNQ
jgi:hypothetical protein